MEISFQKPRPHTRGARQINEAFIQQTFRTHTIQQQVEATGMTLAYVRTIRSRLIRAGVVRRTESGSHGRMWDEAQIQDAIALLQQGLATHQIARKLNRSHSALMQAFKKRGISVDQARSGVWQVRSLNQFATMMGINHARATHWVELGWLKVRRNGAWRQKSKYKKFVERLITDEALEAFFRCREAWTDYDPASIQDPFWREFAEEARAEAGGHWVSSREYARERHYRPTYGAQMIRRGFISEPCQKINGRWFIWIEDGQQ